MAHGGEPRAVEVSPFRGAPEAWTRRAAVQALDPKAYSPPSTEPPGTSGSRNLQEPPATPPAPQRERHIYPKDGDWPFTHPVPPSAVAKVDAIRNEAMANGWREARLYQNRGRFRFPCGEDYGLVCFVDGDERIGEVTRQSIEIIGPPPRESVLRFYNPDVEQPWHRTNRQERRFGRAEGAPEGCEPGMASVKTAGTH